MISGIYITFMGTIFPCFRAFPLNRESLPTEFTYTCARTFFLIMLLMVLMPPRASTFPTTEPLRLFLGRLYYFDSTYFARLGCHFLNLNPDLVYSDLCPDIFQVWCPTYLGIFQVWCPTDLRIFQVWCPTYSGIFQDSVPLSHTILFERL